jgi:hypothetical protein
MPRPVARRRRRAKAWRIARLRGARRPVDIRILRLGDGT